MINDILVGRPKIGFASEINLDFLLKNFHITFPNFPAIQVNYLPLKDLIHLELL